MSIEQLTIELKDLEERKDNIVLEILDGLTNDEINGIIEGIKHGKQG